MDNNRIQSLINIPLGLAAGDSLGSTSEFQAPWDVGSNCVLLYRDYGWPGKQTGGGIGGWGLGDPTDDTDMAMAILRSYVEEGNNFNPEGIRKHFVAWKDTGPPDIGGTCYRTLAIVSYPQFKFYRGGLDDWKKYPDNAANGAIMRNGVIAFLYPNPDQEIMAIDKTLIHTIITHYAPRCVLTCVIHTLLIRNAIDQKRAPTIQDIRDIVQVKWQQWKTQTKDETCLFWLNSVKDCLIEDEKRVVQELEGFENEDYYTFNYEGISGYCVLTLKIALWAAYWSYRQDCPTIPNYLPTWPFQRHGYDTIMWVAMIGADSDTYAATAGPLLGALHGNIHNDFLEGLVVKNEIQDIFNKIYNNNNNNQ